MPRRQKKYHYIYKTTCQVTGKFYVGMHSTDDLNDGYLGSGKILGYSRKKHGDENHIKEILEMCSSREALKIREQEIVNEQLLADPLNINLKYGGEGGWDHILNSSARQSLQSRRSSLGGKASIKIQQQMKVGWWASDRSGRNNSQKKVSDDKLLNALLHHKNVSRALLSLGLARTGGSRRRAERLMAQTTRTHGDEAEEDKRRSHKPVVVGSSPTITTKIRQPND